MTKRLLIITIIVLQLAHVFTINHYWNCLEGDINIALIYDCQYNLQLQQDFFTEFLYMFPPFKLINQQYDDVTPRYSYNLFLMTYSVTEMIMFETLSQDNFTDTKFNDSILQINTSSCPKDFPIENLLHETREVFNNGGKFQRNLALFVLDSDKNDEKYNRTMSRLLEDTKSLNEDIKLFFIIINKKIILEETGLNSISTNSLEKTGDLVTRSIAHIYNECNTLFKGYKHKHQCYFVLTGDTYITREEASKRCGEVHYKSQLVSLNTESEYQYIQSVLENEFINFINRHEVCLDGSSKRCKCIISQEDRNEKRKYIKQSHCYKSKSKTQYETRKITAFIGPVFRLNNFYEEFIWDDGTPFVLKADFSSHESGDDCIYLLQSYVIDYSIGSIVEYWFQFYLDDCKIQEKIYYLLCESQMSDIKITKITVHDLQQKKHSTNDHVLYKSFSPFLTSLNGYENNDTISIRNHKLIYNVFEIEHKSFCNTLYEKLDSRIYSKSFSLKLAIYAICKSNDIPLCTSYPLMCQKVRNNLISSNIYSETQHNFIELQSPNSNDNMCLYESVTDVCRDERSNNRHLQNCERFMCPEGFVKCPDSYCIPAYFVDDGIKDCPHGEDENVVNAVTTPCLAKVKFILKNVCLPSEFCKGKKYCAYYKKKFVSHIQCSEDYFFISNIIRNGDNNNITYKLRVLETTSQLYNDTNSFYFSPHIYFLFPLFNIIEIYLSKCMIKNLDDVIGQIDISAVINLDVSRNDFSSKSNFSVLKNVGNLQNLNISYNQNLELNEEFIFPSNIKKIDLSYTRCGNGVLKYLDSLTQLKTLEMRHVEPIDLSNVSGNVELDILDVRGTEILNLKAGYLSWLTIGKGLYTDDYRLCCEVIRGGNISAKTCHAPRDAISTCHDLIGDPLKRVILWVVGVLSLLGNLVVVIYRLVWDSTVFKTAYGLFVVCLGVSDFIMGVYLLIVAAADILYRNLYVLNDMYWRHSNMCQLAGILSTFSSETSTMFICLITLDRYLVIRYPFGQHRFSKSGKITSICLTLIIGVVVSVIPVVFPDWEIYSTNGMCLALPFSAGRHMGWEYSAILFVGLNFILFIIIAIGQLAIIRAINSKGKTSSCKRNNLRRSQNFAVARQLFLVAMSDFCCWFPIGIMGIMSLNGYYFNPEVYAWSAVLILPVNSAINPLIYTFPVVIRKIRSNDAISSMSLRDSFKN